MSALHKIDIGRSEDQDENLDEILLSAVKSPLFKSMVGVPALVGSPDSSEGGEVPEGGDNHAEEDSTEGRSALKKLSDMAGGNFGASPKPPYWSS